MQYRIDLDPQPGIDRLHGELQPVVLGLEVSGARDVACAQAHRQATVEMQRSPYAEKGPGYGENPMLFIVGLLIVSIAVVIIPRMRLPRGVNAAPLGWMSERWLAEHRASHSP